MRDWRDCPELPGWEFKAERYDYGSRYGVAVMGDGRQFGHRITEASGRPDADLYAEAINALKAKIAA